MIKHFDEYALAYLINVGYGITVLGDICHEGDKCRLWNKLIGWNFLRKRLS